MKRIDGPIKTTLEEGDRYVDEPVLKDTFVYGAKDNLPATVLSHYKRIPLRWMKPGLNGKLIPR